MPSGVEAQIDAFVEDAAELDVVAHGAAAQLAVLLGGFLARRIALPVACLDALVEQTHEFAAVVGPQRRCRVRQLVRRDEIAASDLRRVHAGLACGMLDQSFHEVGGLGPAGAAVGAALRRVGEQTLRHDVQGLDVVGLGHEADRHGAGGQRGPDEIGADLEQHAGAKRKNLAVVVECELAVIDHLAAVVVVEHALAAGGGPLHRAAEFARCP